MVAGTSLIVPSGAISTTTFTPDLVTAAKARCKSDCLNLDARRLPRLGDMAARASDDWAGPYDVHDPEQSDNASVNGLLACDGMRFKVAIVANTPDSWRWQEKLSPLNRNGNFAQASTRRSQLGMQNDIPHTALCIKAQRCWVSRCRALCTS